METIGVTTGACGDPIGKNIDIEFRAAMTSTDQPHEAYFGIVSAVPLPAALPLFATGLAGLGLPGALLSGLDAEVFEQHVDKISNVDPGS